MKPGNTDPRARSTSQAEPASQVRPASQAASASQARRRKNAVLGALSTTLLRLTGAVVLLWLRSGKDSADFFAKLLLVFTVLDLGSIPFIWISLKERLKEIQGGEEDAAAQY